MISEIEQHRDQIIAINPTCVFPWCHRPAGNLALDHIDPSHPAQSNGTGGR